MNKKVLVISPHHDDEVIGCGGSIIKLTKMGYKVSVVYVLAGHSGVPAFEEKKATAIREKETKESNHVLGISKAFFLRERDRELVYNSTTLKKIVKIIRNVRPCIILIPYENDSDLEHKVVSRLSQEALWLANSSYVPKWGIYTPWSYKMILFYEVWSPIEKPNLFIDITDFIDKKSKALTKYSSQLSLVEYDKAILGLNRYRGVMSFSGKYSEAFKIKKLKESMLNF